MKTLVIHEVNRDLFDFSLSEYNITFDDALYSQYFYWPLLKRIKSKKILFISPCLINTNKGKRDQYNGTHATFPSCFESMDLFKKNNDKTNYMTLDEVKYLIADGLEVGGHSFYHFKYVSDRLFEVVSYMKNDTELLIKWFQEMLGIKPRSYAFPHYIEHKFQRSILESYGFKKFYGKERIQVESLL